jgi:hypothetical protein
VAAGGGQRASREVVRKEEGDHGVMFFGLAHGALPAGVYAFGDV